MKTVSKITPMGSGAAAGTGGVLIVALRHHLGQGWRFRQSHVLGRVQSPRVASPKSRVRAPDFGLWTLDRMDKVLCVLRCLLPLLFLVPLAVAAEDEDSAQWRKRLEQLQEPNHVRLGTTALAIRPAE